jgi:hypothetical protein
MRRGRLFIFLLLLGIGDRVGVDRDGFDANRLLRFVLGVDRNAFERVQRLHTVNHSVGGKNMKCLREEWGEIEIDLSLVKIGHAQSISSTAKRFNGQHAGSVGNQASICIKTGDALSKYGVDII